MDLRLQAEQMGRLLPVDRFHPRAWAFASASAGRNERWALAISGGADSVALLLLIWAHFPSQRNAMIPVHFNHRLRGAESDADEAYCRDVCAQLGLTLRLGSWSDAPEKATEEQARQARYSFFEHTVTAEHAMALFTGHQRNDIVETQLMRLARGASAAGLAAPRPLRPWLDTRTILRPLLTIDRAEIQESLRAVGVTWREDSSNIGAQYFRNRIRSAVVPSWLQVSSPDAMYGAALTREWMEEDDCALESVLDELGIPREMERIDLHLLAGKPRALWRRALRRWIPSRGMSWTAFDRLLTLAAAGEGRCSVGNGFAVAQNGILTWSEASDRTLPETWCANWIPGTVTMFLPDGSSLLGRRVTVGSDLLDRLRRGELDPAKEAFVELPSEECVVRSWIHGDRYRPLGAPGSAKLQDLFVNRKISPGLRTRLPVVCQADGQIVWVPGFPPADQSKLTDHSVTAVQLTYIPGTSTVEK